MDQIYCEKPDMPEDQIKEGLLCAGLCALPGQNIHWMRVLVSNVYVILMKIVALYKELYTIRLRYIDF